MLKSEIRIGKDYGFREKRVIGSPLSRVRIIEYIRKNKWKARWIEPNSGLVDFVESGQLIVPWKAHKAFLREETDSQRLWEHNRQTGYKDDSPVIRALEQIFSSAGDDVQFNRGVLSGSQEALDRFKARAKVVGRTRSPYEYVDRLGKTHVPFDVALELGRAFCASEPSTVLVDIEVTERDWSHKASLQGEEYIISLLNEYRASWALIRQWTGHDPAVAQREAEIKRLERLVWDAIYVLQKAKLDSEAARLRRAMESR